MPNNNATYLNTLHQFLNQHSTLAELQPLCSALAVDCEKLAGATPSERTWSLLLTLAQNGRIPQFITLLQQEQPDVACPPVPDAWQHPFIEGDFVGGDKIMGDSIQGDQIDVDAGNESVIAAGAGATAVGPRGVFIGRDMKGDIRIGDNYYGMDAPPPEPTTADLEKYLEFLKEEYGTLRLPMSGGEPVELERIYVSLKADAMNAAERESEYRYFREDIALMERGQRQGLLDVDDVEDLHALGRHAYQDKDAYLADEQVREVIKKRPLMMMLTARNREMLFGEREQTILSLAQVVERHPYVVILGDPGSGKTTLCRWLALQFTTAMQSQKETVRIPADRVHPGDKATEWVDFGITRLPVFISIGQYAKARFPKGQESKGNGLTLSQFILEGKQYPADTLTNHQLAPAMMGALARPYLEQGRALIILDGLDEVNNPTERRLVMEAVDAFIAAQSDAAQNQERAEILFQPGNKILLTSRIVGYQFRPLTHLPHYTVENMDEMAIRAFTTAWISHVPQVATDAVAQEAERLQTAIFNAHRGVQLLAGNPLLLTILAQVYWQRPNRDLPTRRVKLFEEAESAFYAQRPAYWQAADISQETLGYALGAVAMYMHTHEVTGFASERDVELALRQTTLNRSQIKTVLDAARDASGFLIARGEGVYGFLHRGLQEYYAARFLVDNTDQEITKTLTPYLLDPTWREPIVLAIGMMSESRRQIQKIFSHLLHIDDPAGAYLPRRELVAVAACSECYQVPTEIGRQLGTQLLAFYADREGRGKSPVLRERLEKAWTTLHHTAAQQGAEEALCIAIQSPDFEQRYAAIGLVLTEKWYTRSIVKALVTAWSLYAAPAGSMLQALHELSQVEAALFDNLPELTMRQAMLAQPDIWKKIQQNDRWRTVVRVLYLPVGADFAPQFIHRNSPLTPHLLSILQQKTETWDQGLDDLLETLPPIIQNGNEQIRDAALILSACGRQTWISDFAQTLPTRIFGKNGAAIRAVFSAKFFILNLARDRDRALALALARDRARTHDLDHARSRARARDLDLDRTLDRTLDPDRDLDRDRNYLTTINEIVEKVKGYENIDDDLVRALDSIQQKLLYLKKIFNMSVDFQLLAEVNRVLIETANQILPKNQVSLLPQPLSFQLSSAQLPQLIDSLQSMDDVQRQAARECLRPTTSHQTAILGQPLVERIATLAQAHKKTFQIGTQLAWSLLQMQHTEPIGLKKWVNQANDHEESPAMLLLGSLHYMNDAVLQELIHVYEIAQPATQQTILGSLSWFARLRKENVDEVLLAHVADTIIDWYQHAEIEETRLNCLKALGYWPHLADRWMEKLIERGASPNLSESEQKAVVQAVVCQASHTPHHQERVSSLLQAILNNLNIHPAWIRLQVALIRTDQEESQISHPLLLEIEQHLAISPQEKLAAIWQAGVDDDLWDDNYHAILTQTARLHLSQHPELFPPLLNSYFHALSQESWQERRILLSILAACLETMPQTVQEASRNTGMNLEEMLVKGTQDFGSHNSRRFALTGLSYLRHVSANIIPVLIASLMDNVKVVHQAAIKACHRFHSVDMALIPELGEYLTGESVQTAYGVSQMLAAIGVVAAGEQSDLRQEIILQLVDALQDTGCQRKYTDKTDRFFSLTRKLEEAFYESLLQVAGLPA